MHNHNELTRSSLPNWSQRQDFPVSSDKIVEWLLGRRAATWCNISLGHVRFIHSCFLSRYNLDTNVWSLFLLGRRWRYRGSLRLNPGSHLSFFFFLRGTVRSRSSHTETLTQAVTEMLPQPLQTPWVFKGTEPQQRSNRAYCWNRILPLKLWGCTVQRCTTK